MGSSLVSLGVTPHQSAISCVSRRYGQNKSLLHRYISSLAKVKQSPREITEEPPLDQSVSYEIVLCFVYLMGLAVLGSRVLGRSCTTGLHPQVLTDLRVGSCVWGLPKQMTTSKALYRSLDTTPS